MKKEQNSSNIVGQLLKQKDVSSVNGGGSYFYKSGNFSRAGFVKSPVVQK